MRKLLIALLVFGPLFAADKKGTIAPYNTFGKGDDAVSRNVEDKLRDTANIKDYGGDPTGAIDSKPATDKALAANPGKNIFFPAGTYIFSASVTIPDQHFGIVGEGKASTKFHPAANFSNPSSLFTVTGTSAVEGKTRVFRDFTIDFAQPDISRQISSVVVSSNVGTVDTTAAHGYTTGDIVIFFNFLSPMPLALNGRYVVASTPSGTQFTIATVGVSDSTYSPALAYVQSKVSLKQWTAISAASNNVNGMTVDNVAIKGAWNGVVFKGTYSGGWTKTVSEGKFSKIDISAYNRGFDIDGMLGTSMIVDSSCSAAYQSARGGTAGGYSLLEDDISTDCYHVGRADDLKLMRSGAGIVGKGLSVTTSDGGDPRTAWVTITDAIFDGQTGLWIVPTTNDVTTPHIRVENSYFYLVGEGAATYTNRPVHKSIHFTGGYLQVSNSFFLPATADAAAIDPVHIEFAIAGKQNTASFVGNKFVEYSGVKCDKPFLTQAQSATPGTLTIVGSSVSRNAASTYTTPAFDFQQASGSSVQVTFSGNTAGRFGGDSLLYKFVKDDNHVAFGNSFNWNTSTSAGWKTQYVAGIGQYQQWDAGFVTPVFRDTMKLLNTDYDHGTIGSSLEFGFSATTGLALSTIQAMRSSVNAQWALALNPAGGNVVIGKLTDDSGLLQVAGAINGVHGDFAPAGGTTNYMNVRLLQINDQNGGQTWYGINAVNSGVTSRLTIADADSAPVMTFTRVASSAVENIARLSMTLVPTNYVLGGTTYTPTLGTAGLPWTNSYISQISGTVSIGGIAMSAAAGVSYFKTGNDFELTDTAGTTINFGVNTDGDGYFRGDLQIGASTTAGFVLTASSGAVGTWQALPANYITGVSGTSPISASVTTGVLTVACATCLTSSSGLVDISSTQTITGTKTMNGLTIPAAGVMIIKNDVTFENGPDFGTLTYPAGVMYSAGFNATTGYYAYLGATQYTGATQTVIATISLDGLGHVTGYTTAQVRVGIVTTN